MNVKSTGTEQQSFPDQPSRGRADLARLRNASEQEIERTSPPELSDLPANFWDDAVVVPAPKRAISLRVDQDVLEWFRSGGPRYQTRMNAVLRAYVSRMRRDQARRRKARPQEAG